MVWRVASLVVAVVLVAAGCGSQEDGEARPSATGAATTSETSGSSAAAPSQDPAADIEGVEVVEYGVGHVASDQRVAYDRFPPFGGRHDGVWAACNGVVYATAVRNENMIHSLEHGAVWIAYDPARVTGAELAALQGVVRGQPYLMISPYPGLDRPVSLQSWGHQLKLDSTDDPRITAFIRALRANPATHPEPGATCDVNPSTFDVDNPPPFDPTPPGPDAVPVE